MSEPSERVVTFQVERSTVAVAVDSDAIAQGLPRLFPDYVLEAGPRASRRLDIRESDQGWVIAGSRHAPSEAFTTPEAALSAVEYVLTLELLERCAHLPQLHAAGTIAAGSAIVALGPSGAGKSTLALVWSTRGRPVLGDDIVLLDDQGRAAPFKRLFAVDPARLRDSGCTPDPLLLSLGDESDGWYDPRSGGGWAVPSPVGVVGILRYEPGARVRVQELSAVDTLAAVVAGLIGTGPPASACFDRLCDMVRPARCVEIVHGDAVTAAETLVELA